MPPDVVSHALCYDKDGLTEKELYKNPDGVTYSDEWGNVFEWADKEKKSGYYLKETPENEEEVSLYQKMLEADPKKDDPRRQEFLRALAKDKIRNKNRREYLAKKEEQKAAEKKAKRLRKSA